MSDDKERDEWIAAHGSERLRLALRMGIAAKSAGVYRDERLAAELPGWQWLTKDTDVSDAINPSLLALRSLDAAPFPGELAKVRGKNQHLSPAGRHWREAVLVSPPWADGRRAVRFVGSDDK